MHYWRMIRSYWTLADAAYKRAQIEQPIRAMWVDLRPKKEHKKPFGMVLLGLRSMGYITRPDFKLIQSEYKRLSNIIHGVA